jgi:tetratricopeptide (TPR) repeat protein
MRSRLLPVLVAASLTGLGLTAAGCGKYSISNLRATQAFQTANEQYKKGEYKVAIAEYERAITFNPDLGYAYFFLGNCYDNQYKSTKKGDPENDANLTKAVDNYKLAIDKLKGSTDPRGPEIRKLSFEYLIAAYGAEKLNDIEKAVPIAQELISSEPNEPTNYQALGKLYEENGRYEESEAMFKKAIEVKSNDPLSYEVLAGFYNRQGEFDKTMEAYEKRAAMEPNNPEAWHQMGPYYSEKAMKDLKLPKETARKYVMRGLEVEDKALAINPEFWSAMAYKNILLRQQATYEKDPAKQKELLSQADQIRARSIELQKRQNAEAGGTKKGK